MHPTEENVYGSWPTPRILDDPPASHTPPAEERFPTPTAYDATGHGNPRAEQKEGSRHAVSLHHLAADEEWAEGDALWPTPRVGGGNRTSRQSLTNEKGHPKGRSSVGLEQAVELADGQLPSEMEGLEPEDVIPSVRSTPRTAQSSMYAEDEKTLKARGRDGSDTLANAVEQEERRMWPTPSAVEPGGGDDYIYGLVNKEGEPLQPGERAFHPDSAWHIQITLDRAVKLWPTPMASSNRTSKKAQTGRPTSGPSRGGPSFGLEDAVEDKEGNWPTPRANDWKGADRARDENRSGNRHAGDDQATAVDKRDTDPQMLNPDWVDWLMGWPVGWTSLEPLPEEALKHWTLLSTHNVWWNQEPPDVPRTTSKRKLRTNRLKADGNGQVSLCAAAAFVGLYKSLGEIETKIERAKNPVVQSVCDDYLKPY